MKYTFTVETEEPKECSSLLSSIVEEAKSEHRQLSLARKINEETAIIHRKIIEDIRDRVISEITSVGISPSEIKNNIEVLKHRNTSQTNYILDIGLKDSRHSRRIQLFAISDSQFKDSKYDTCTGAYELKDVRLTYPSIIEHSNIVEYTLLALKNDIKQCIKDTLV